MHYKSEVLRYGITRILKIQLFLNSYKYQPSWVVLQQYLGSVTEIVTTRNAVPVILYFLIDTTDDQPF